MIAGTPYVVAIVEDDQKQADVLERMLLSYPGKERFSTTRFASIASLQEYAMGGGCSARSDQSEMSASDNVYSGSKRIDIALMDIRFDQETATGIDAVAALFPPGCGTQVIYVTGYSDFCTMVYRTEHVYFLVKPVDQNDLNDALVKAVAGIDYKGGRPIVVSVGGKFVRLAPTKIRYVESDRRKVRIHMVDGSMTETYTALSTLADALPSSFVQCHKGFLVNMMYVAEVQSDAVCLLSGDHIPMSRARRNQVRELFVSYLHNRG